MSRELTRRRFIAAATVTAAAAGAGLSVTRTTSAAEKPALLGGTRVRTKPFPPWPKIGQAGRRVAAESPPQRPLVPRRQPGSRPGSRQAYAKLTGAKHCVATANGTAALVASLGALGVGPGDEVIVPPYTFVATVTSVLMHYALPVFVDSDPETFQIDPRKIEAAITDRTAAILPVHIGGSVADLDAILAIGDKHKLPVIEDACQAHLAEWKGRKVGTWGTTGCFSFQVTKNLCSGEGGAILTADLELAQKCYAFHNNCRARQITGYNFTYLGARSQNLRMTEFQGALLQAQMTRVEAAIADPHGKRPVPDQHAQGHPRHPAGEDVRGLHAQRLPLLHAPLQARTVRQPAAGEVPRCPFGRRDPMLAGLLAAQ